MQDVCTLILCPINCFQQVFVSSWSGNRSYKESLPSSAPVRRRPRSQLWRFQPCCSLQSRSTPHRAHAGTALYYGRQGVNIPGWAGHSLTNLVFPSPSYLWVWETRSDNQLVKVIREATSYSLLVDLVTSGSVRQWYQCSVVVFLLLLWTTEAVSFEI